MGFYRRLASYTGGLLFFVVCSCPCIHAQDGIVVPSAKCLAPQLSFISDQFGLHVRFEPSLGEALLPPNVDTNLTAYGGVSASPLPQIRLSAKARYQDGQVVVTVTCTGNADAIPKAGGGTIPVVYKFDDASGTRVRTASESKTADDTLYTNLTTAIDKAVKDGRLTNDQIQSAVDRVQSQLHAKLESALVDDVSRKLGSTNLLDEIAKLKKQVAALQDQMTKLQPAAQPPPKQ